MLIIINTINEKGAQSGVEQIHRKESSEHKNDLRIVFNVHYKCIIKGIVHEEFPLHPRGS